MDDTSFHGVTLPRARLVLIHGVGITGEWYEVVADALGRFFDVVRFKYDGYRALGPLPVLTHWFGLIGCLPLLIGAVMALWLPPIGLTVSMAGAAILFGGILARKVTARKAWRELKDMLPGAAPRPGEAAARVHAIAHSFGTYILVIGSNEPPTRYVDRAILVGTPLARRTRWRPMFRPTSLGRAQIGFVRNEVGLNDLVAQAAHVAGVLYPELGGAGFKGFRQMDGDVAVHTQPNPATECRECEVSGSARVHNVVFSGHDHAANFRAGSYVLEYWLPFLLAMEPSEFAALLNVAVELAARSKVSTDLDVTDPVVDKLSKPWKTFGNQSLFRTAALALTSVDIVLMAGLDADGRNRLIFHTLLTWGRFMNDAYASVADDGEIGHEITQNIDPRIALDSAATAESRERHGP